MELKFYINQQLVAPPRNWKDIQTELLFTDDRPSATVQSIQFEWVNTVNSKNASLLISWRAQGLSGGVGVLEGVPLRITDCSPQAINIFEGVIDLAHESCEFECDIVKAPIKESGRIDYVNSISDSFSFSYLFALPSGAAGKISVTDFKLIPYTITHSKNEALVVIPLAISIFLIEKEIEAMIALIKKDISEVVSLATPVTPAEVLQLAAKILEITFDIIYIGAMLIALVKLINQIFTYIIQLPKYKYGMEVRTLFQKACDYMGLKFSSTILQSGAYQATTIVPRKVAIMNGSYLNPFKRPYDENGAPNAYGYYDGTFKQLIVQMQDYFNASCKVIKGTLYFERIDYWQKQTSFQLKNLGKPGFTFNYPDPHKINASELSANYEILYSLDSQDDNTYNRYVGSQVNITCSPKIVSNQKNVLLHGLTSVNLGFGLAKRKDHLNLIEDIVGLVVKGFNGLVNAILTAINFVTGIFGAPPIPLLPSNPMGNRLGWMELSSDFIGVQKIFTGMPGAKHQWILKPTNEYDTAANTLFTTFHFINLPTRGNQWILYENKTLAVCCKDYLILSNNNYVKTHDNKNAKVTRLLWNWHKEEATIDYRVQQDYTKNLQETIIIDGKN